MIIDIDESSLLGSIPLLFQSVKYFDAEFFVGFSNKKHLYSWRDRLVIDARLSRKENQAQVILKYRVNERLTASANWIAWPISTGTTKLELLLLSIL